MAQIPPPFFNCVVAIGERVTKTKIEWIATAFFVAKFAEIKNGAKRYHIFLVTNKHVFLDPEEMENPRADISNIDFNSKFVIRLNQKDGAPAKIFDLSLKDPDENVLVRINPNLEIDIAAISLNPKFLKEMSIEYQAFVIDEHMMPIEKMKENEITAGDFCYILGYPMGNVGVKRQYVIVRGGIIARIQDVLDRISNEIIIDAFVYPGNSGGPVIIKTDFSHIRGTKPIKKADLIGIVFENITYEDTAYSGQTRRPRITFEENSGLCSVYPVDFIVETIGQFYQNSGEEIKKEN